MKRMMVFTSLVAALLLTVIASPGHASTAKQDQAPTVTQPVQETAPASSDIVVAQGADIDVVVSPTPGPPALPTLGLPLLLLLLALLALFFGVL